MDIIFKEAEHSYFRGDIRYSGITSLLGKYKPKKDWDKIAENYSKKGVDHVLKGLSKNWQIPLKQAKEMWEEEFLQAANPKDWVRMMWKKKSNIALESGSFFHNYMEILESKTANYNPIVNGEKHSLDLSILTPGTYLELMCFSHLHHICGQADKMILYEDNSFSLRDYKGLALDTPILTGTGWKTMGELTYGDKVYDRNGELTEIQHISKLHENPCYKIKFDTNDELIADHEHKWVVYFTRGSGKYYKEVEKIFTTEELYVYLQNTKRISETIPKIKCVKLADSEDIILPIDPYVLGVWLGDGTKSSGKITQVSEAVWDELNYRGYELSLNHERFQEDKTGETKTLFGLQTKLRKLGLLNNKHIPDIYFTASYSQRLDLLRGFMDADGYYNKCRKRFVASTTQKWQANSFHKLISSLGWKCSILETYTCCTNCEDTSKKKAWDVCFNAVENPFLTRNKSCIQERGVKRDTHTYRSIKSIERVDTVITKCISVKSETETYLAGYGLITTHNTSLTIDIEPKTFYSKGSKKRVAEHYLSPISHLTTNNYITYCLQLSCYAYMLELYGYKCKDLWIDHVIWEYEKPSYKLKKGELVIGEEPEFNRIKVYKRTDSIRANYLKPEVKALFNQHKNS